MRKKKPLTIPKDYSDAFKLTQLEFMPEAKDLPRINPDTGEKYSPGELWKLLAQKLVAEKRRRENKNVD